MGYRRSELAPVTQHPHRGRLLASAATHEHRVRSHQSAAHVVKPVRAAHPASAFEASHSQCSPHHLHAPSRSSDHPRPVVPQLPLAIQQHNRNRAVVAREQHPPHGPERRQRGRRDRRLHAGQALKTAQPPARTGWLPVQSARLAPAIGVSSDRRLHPGHRAGPVRATAYADKPPVISSTVCCCSRAARHICSFCQGVKAGWQPRARIRRFSLPA